MSQRAWLSSLQISAVIACAGSYTMRDEQKHNIEFDVVVERYPVIYDCTKSGYSKRKILEKHLDGGETEENYLRKVLYI
jgi:hypothetical protein